MGEGAGAADAASASLAVGAAGSASQGGRSDEAVLARGEGEVGSWICAGVSEAADVVLSSSLSSSKNRDRDRDRDRGWD